MKTLIVVIFTCVNLITLVSQNALANPEINYDRSKQLLSVHADTTSFKALLRGLANKTGIKIKITRGIPDKKITLDTEQLPIHAIGDLLDDLRLHNTALLYDHEGNISEIYILPEGKTKRPSQGRSKRRRRYR